MMHDACVGCAEPAAFGARADNGSFARAGKHLPKAPSPLDVTVEKLGERLGVAALYRVT
jgi:DNA-binding transcriptional LysR family regulator